MNRFNSFWLVSVLAALGLLLLIGAAASAQEISQPRGETILTGFLSCSGPNGERQCPFRLHYVEMVRGNAYALRLESTEMDAALMIEDEHGNLMARDTDNMDSMPGCIVFRPETTGTYRVVVSALSPLREGFYTVAMRELPVIFNVEQALQPTDPMMHECHMRTYDVPMMEGQRYIIDLRSRDFLPYLKLTDADGMIVAFQDESDARRGARVVYTPTRSGSFRLVVTTVEPLTFGNFMLGVSEEGPVVLER